MIKTNKKLLIIDGDALVYHSSKEKLQESIDILDERVQNIFHQTGGDYYLMFISLGMYFRHHISAEYKSGRRKHVTPLLWVKTLKNYLIEQYGAIAGRNVEADDLCCYFMNKEFFCGTPKYSIQSSPTLEDSIVTTDNDSLFNSEGIDKILCSPDKDLLKSLTGTHFNYSYYLENKEDPDSLVKGYWVKSTKESSEEFIWTQLLMGDSADSVIGIPKIGKKRAEKYFKEMIEVNSDTVNYPNWVLDAYLNYYGKSQGIYEFQKNYRLLHLLESDKDFLREVGYVPELPPVRKTSIVEQEVEENF